MPRSATVATIRHLDVEIVVEHDAWTAVDGLDAAITAAAQRAYVRGAKVPARPAAVTIALLSDAEVQALNLQFRGLDKPTNVLSFPAPPNFHPKSDGDGAPALGDIVLGFETVTGEAARDSIAVIDHIRHLVVHGILHLQGYDHETDEDAEAMEALESRILAELGVADPYAC